MEYVLWSLGLVFAIVLGLGWGSYATMATYRFPRGESWSGKKPRCPSCNHELKFKDFAPVYAYVVSRGKCKFCGVKVTPVYLCTEIYTTLLFILSYIQFGFGELFLLVSTLGVFIAIMTTTELESKTIPDKALLLMLALAIPYRVLVDHSIYGVFWGGVMGMLAGYGYYAIQARIQHQPFDWHNAFLQLFSSEYTYVRLLIVLGVCLSPLSFLIVLAIGTLLAALWRYIWRRVSLPFPVPYGATYMLLAFIMLLIR